MATGLFDRIRGFMPPRQAAKPFSEQGVGGYVVVGGAIIHNESNSALLGHNRWRTAAQMLTGVSIVAASLRYTLNLMARPAWKADPANDKAEAKAAADFVDELLADIGTNWTRIVRRSAMYRFHGFGINEWVAKKRDDGKIGIASVEQRPQHTIERWDIDLNGGVIGVWQRDPLTARELYLPRRKLIYLVDDTLTDRPDGMGWFRHLVDPMNRLNAFLKLEGIGFQRDLTGIPIGRAPLQRITQLVKDGKLKQADADRMIEGIKDFCRLEAKNENTGLILDSTTYRGKTQEGEQVSQISEWGMELLTGSQSSIADLGQAIERIEYEMALILGTSSLLTGRGDTGSRALSEDQSRNLYLTVNSTLDDMTGAFQTDLIDPIWAMNGLPDELKPRLTHEDASFQDASKIASMLRDMATAGAILAPDDPAINDLRDLAGISAAPPMDAEMLALLRGDPTGNTNDPNADPNKDPNADGGGGKRPNSGRGRAKKYDPNQPRDQVGRWTDDAIGRLIQGVPSDDELAGWREQLDRQAELYAGDDSPMGQQKSEAIAHMDLVVRRREEMRLSQLRDNKVAFATERDGSLAAAGMMRIDGQNAEISNLGSLSPGAGAEIMDSFVATARGRGVETIRLETEIKGYYEQWGFSSDGDTHYTLDLKG